MRLPVSVLSLALGIAVADAQPAPESRQPDHRGYSMGLDPVVYAQLMSDGITGGRRVGGYGVALRFGWGFTDQVALVLDVAVTDLAVADTAGYLLSHGDILLRYTPVALRGPLGKWAPFVTAGLGFRDVDADGPSPSATRIYTFAGEELTLGVGTSLFVVPEFSIFAAGYWSTGEFNDERVGNTTTHSRHVAGTSTRLALGVTWHRRPRASRPFTR